MFLKIIELPEMKNVLTEIINSKDELNYILDLAEE